MTEPVVFDIKETDRLLTTTRSVRRRLDLTRPVPRAVIEEALEIAVQAPTAENTQAWRWIVVTDPAVRAEIAAVYQRAWAFHRADTKSRSSRRRHSPGARRIEASVDILSDTLALVPALVIPCVLGPAPDPAAIDAAWVARMADRETDEVGATARIGHAQTSMYYGSIYPAIWSFQLALRSRGLGSAITVMHLAFAGQVAAILGIPAGITQICLLPVAYTIGPDFRPAPRFPAAQRTFWDRWGASGSGSGPDPAEEWR